MIRPRPVTLQEWRQLVAPIGSLNTEVAFDIGRRRASPKYAYITSDSYNKFVNELEEKCRKTQDENIAEMRLNNLENEYFRWEEYEFNRALVKTLFPETTQGDNSRFLSSTKVLHQIRLSELESQCQLAAVEDDWSYKTDEKTQFEDYLINKIFQPRFIGEYAQALIEQLEYEKKQEEQDHDISFPNQNPSDNSSSTTTSSNTGRKRRQVSFMSNRHLKDVMRTKVRQYKARRHV